MCVYFNGNSTKKIMIRLHFTATANYLKLLKTNLLTYDYNTKLLHSQLHFSEQENQPLGKTYLITNQQPSKHQGQISVWLSAFFFWAAEPGHWLGGPSS